MPDADFCPKAENTVERKVQIMNVDIFLITATKVSGLLQSISLLCMDSKTTGYHAVVLLPG
ncbi:MAG: hypothetical protein EAZ17_05095 [Sphingobacteriales bacterium]|nr:MAG: hypothetical protein EAZ17_05095 [Sphingobacteriales bacterium]